jgi:16S rRNA (guanine527-N7)-methyltransferase
MKSQELLSSGARELDIELSIDQVNLFFLYLDELKKWNRKINLTAIRDERDIVIKHILDSLSYIKGFTPTQGLRLLDMGSGAGFPAIPIKITAPGVTVTLVESVKKKASFLRHIARLLNLNHVTVLDQRTEELDASYHAAFDVVTARAFADMEKALAAGKHFLTSQGHMVLSRGPDENIRDQAMKRIGFTLEKREELTLPFSEYKRAIWVFAKTG